MGDGDRCPAWHDGVQCMYLGSSHTWHFGLQTVEWPSGTSDCKSALLTEAAVRRIVCEEIREYARAAITSSHMDRNAARPGE